jgi:hypothetical protein
MADPEDCAPEAEMLAVALGKAAADCAEAGMDLNDCIEVIQGAYDAWFLNRPGGPETL